MTFRMGWLTPFNNRTGVGTFSKAVTDALPDSFDGRTLDVTIFAPVTAGMYSSRHRILNINTIDFKSRIYEMFDILLYNIGNNDEHHGAIISVLRNYPGIVICHDYVYQHVLAKMAQEGGSDFADYIALAARYGSPEGLRRVRESNITRLTGLHYAVWDSDFCADMPLGAPLFQLGSALVVHSRYAEDQAKPSFDGPILRLGMPYDQRPVRVADADTGRIGRRGVVVSFGHVQPQKCIHDVLLAMAESPRLREGLVYVVSGFSSNAAYLERLRGLVAEHALGTCVRFALDLEDEDLADLSAQADAFINLRFPNTEGASVSLIEQLITGKPVVVFDSGCYAEVPDDAVIKVVGRRDADAVADAMHRLLGDRATLAAIGSRGRAHAMRRDSRGYAAQLLTFVSRQKDLLRRRSDAVAIQSLDAARPGAAECEHDAAWREALAVARGTMSRLEMGILADDPTILTDLGPEQIVDFVQAARLRRSTDLRLTATLRAFFGDGRDAVGKARILHAVNAIASAGDDEAAALLPEIVPTRDVAFWDVVAALGEETLIDVIAGTCFGARHPDAWKRARTSVPSGLRRIRLASVLARSEPSDLRVTPEDRQFLVWRLRQGEPSEVDFSLDPLPVGRSIRIGARDQDRFVQLEGFYDIQGDHVWSKPHIALLRLAPDRAVHRIVLAGEILSDQTQVAVSAQTRSGLLEGVRSQTGGTVHFELSLSPANDLSVDRVLHIAIDSTDCSSPADLNLSDDLRPLGFMLKHVISI